MVFIYKNHYWQSYRSVILQKDIFIYDTVVPILQNKTTAPI